MCKNCSNGSLCKTVKWTGCSSDSSTTVILTFLQWQLMFVDVICLHRLSWGFPLLMMLEQKGSIQSCLPHI